VEKIGTSEIGNQILTSFCTDLMLFFHYPPLSQKPIFHFCGTRGKMNTGKKHFCLTRENAVAGTREVSKGGRGGLPLAHDLACKV
jgi:hypothetical protein